VRVLERKKKSFLKDIYSIRNITPRSNPTHSYKDQDTTRKKKKKNMHIAEFDRESMKMFFYTWSWLKEKIAEFYLCSHNSNA